MPRTWAISARLRSSHEERRSNSWSVLLSCSERGQQIIELADRDRVRFPSGGLLQTRRQARSALTASILTPHHSMGDTEQPCPSGVALWHVFETAPRNGEHIGSGIFGVRGPETPGAVSEDGVVVGVEQVVEANAWVLGPLQGKSVGHLCLSGCYVSGSAALLTAAPTELHLGKPDDWHVAIGLLR